MKPIQVWGLSQKEHNLLSTWRVKEVEGSTTKNDSWNFRRNVYVSRTQLFLNFISKIKSKNPQV